MRRPQRSLLAAGVLVAVTGLGVSAVAQDDRPPPPSLDVSERDQPIPRPEEGREVLVVELALTFEEGNLVGAELLSAERIASFAPKVFLRQGGDWTIQLASRPPRRFFVENPGWREVEAESESEQPVWVPVTGTIEWPLVIPLYQDREPFEIDGFRIVETQTEEVLAEFQF